MPDLQIDHIQLAIPKGSEDRCRPFWLALGFVELDKPEPLQARGGLWLRCGQVELHLGVDPDFTPATKAHPGFATTDLDGIAKALTARDVRLIWDHSIPDRRRFFTTDPVGNRLEFLAAGT
ncbi:MAG: glyoxalase [bacterium]